MEGNHFFTILGESDKLNPYWALLIRGLTAYLDGAKRVFAGTPYQVGVYGSYRTIESLDADWYWQTYAWSGGRVSQRANMIQCRNGVNMAGGSNDLNVAWGDPGCWAAPKDVSRPDMPLLRRDDRCWQVSVLQVLLGQHGYSTGGIDGIYGPATERAVKEYQTRSGLGADGIAGPATWMSLWPEEDKTDPRDAEIGLLRTQVLTLRAERDALMERVRAAVEILKEV